MQFILTCTNKQMSPRIIHHAISPTLLQCYLYPASVLHLTSPSCLCVRMNREQNECSPGDMTFIILKKKKIIENELKNITENLTLCKAVQILSENSVHAEFYFKCPWGAHNVPRKRNAFVIVLSTPLKLGVSSSDHGFVAHSATLGTVACSVGAQLVSGNSGQVSHLGRWWTTSWMLWP